MDFKQEAEAGELPMDIGIDNRAFVARDNGLDVYSPTNSSVVKAFTLKHEGQAFTARKLLLGNQNRKISFLSSENEHIIHNFDPVRQEALKFWSRWTDHNLSFCR